MDNFLYILNNKIGTNSEQKLCEELVNQSYAISDKNKKQEILIEAFNNNPRNCDLLIQLGLLFMFNSNKILEYYGFTMLEKAFDNSFTGKIIPIDTYQGKWLAVMIGRYNHLIHCYKTAEKFFRIAKSSSFIKDDTQNIQLSTCITGYPSSSKNAKNIIKNYNKQIDILLAKDNLEIKFLKSNDLYNFCILSPFNFEIYYEADFKECMYKHYLLAKKVFPNLHYVSNKISDQISLNKPYKLGIISAFFYENNSVIEDFGGVIKRLPRDMFDITFIFLKDNNNCEFIYENEKNIIINTCSDKNWLINTREQIENLDLDILYYLDSTMSSTIQRTLMSKLARIQVVSHGHPVTTGVPSEIMNYYVSWSEAELEYNQAKNHYTEKLLLLRNNHMHQYYEHRIDVNKKSRITGESYLNYTRDDFKEYLPDNCNWYTCMQKPFKRHPEFDNFLAGILEKDPNARIILHEDDNEENNNIHISRLEKLEINMDKIHFLPSLPHHKLMALYNLSDVILDSYYAGGCTTTREALEIGALVVTLPSKYLGSRWSLAYYNIIGVTDLVATDMNDYINIATELCANKEKKYEIKQKILNNVHKLFYQESAIDSWVQIFQYMINEYKNN